MFLLNKAWGYLAGAGAIIAALLVGWLKAKQSGREEVITAQATKEVEHAKTASEVDRKVATEQPASVQQRLRDKYSRD